MSSFYVQFQSNSSLEPAQIMSTAIFFSINEIYSRIWHFQKNQYCWMLWSLASIWLSKSFIFFRMHMRNLNRPSILHKIESFMHFSKSTIASISKKLGSVWKIAKGEHQRKNNSSFSAYSYIYFRMSHLWNINNARSDISLFWNCWPSCMQCCLWISMATVGKLPNKTFTLSPGRWQN